MVRACQRLRRPYLGDLGAIALGCCRDRHPDVLKGACTLLKLVAEHVLLELVAERGGKAEPKDEPPPEFRACLDRPFVQLEIRAAKAVGKNIITVFEEERRRPAFFDYAKAWEKYGESEWKFLLDIDSVTYRRDAEEAEAMMTDHMDKGWEETQAEEEEEVSKQ